MGFLDVLMNHKKTIDKGKLDNDKIEFWPHGHEYCLKLMHVKPMHIRNLKFENMMDLKSKFLVQHENLSFLKKISIGLFLSKYFFLWSSLSPNNFN